MELNPSNANESNDELTPNQSADWLREEMLLPISSNKDGNVQNSMWAQQNASNSISKNYQPIEINPI